MNNKFQWQPPFEDKYGNGMVYRNFLLCGELYGVGFEQIMSPHDLASKGIDLLHACPGFTFPANGVWAVVFDSLDPATEEPTGYRHVRHRGLASGRVLLNVASIIYDHYTICNAGAYIFTAAADLEHQRATDLAVIYSRALGLEGHPKSKIFSRLEGWEAYTDVEAGGRGYVVTTQSYHIA
ncbi:hypothetical protein WH279_22330 [Erwinia sp. MYb375]|uniref:hypothetical protein n=1 Tax=unclassified Erwinia TaxID=2622719 RepID=UPI0030B39B7F